MKKKTKKSLKTTKKNKSSMDKNIFLSVLGETWPLDRDVFFRPERLKYVRKLLPIQSCVFCKASTEKACAETLCVYKTKFSMIVINKFPYNSGHILILPRRHCGDLLNLTEDEYSDLHSTLRKAMQAIKDLYQPNGINMGLNQGSAAGAGIPDHLHYHLIPRWSGDVNFFPLIADTKVLVENLEYTYERLKKYFAKLSSESL
ncbi:MAG: HIT family protein [Pseudobdellovibrionaceae bacterium]